MWLNRSSNTAQQWAVRLRRLETRLEGLVEGSAERIFPGMQAQHNLASQLLESMRQGIYQDANGDSFSPNLFILEVNPAQAGSLASNDVFLDGVAKMLQEEGNAAGLRFASPLAIRINEDPRISPGDVRVQALHSGADLTDTSSMLAEPADESPGVLPNAFLIVDGIQVYPIHQVVVNIGRRMDNHIVIDDERISRLHAQLRLVRGQFVIFDLDSTGGTWVNSERIRQKTLQPGDVISLAGLPIVFGQETVYPEDTQKMEFE